MANGDVSMWCARRNGEGHYYPVRTVRRGTLGGTEHKQRGASHCSCNLRVRGCCVRVGRAGDGECRWWWWWWCKNPSTPPSPDDA